MGRTLKRILNTAIIIAASIVFTACTDDNTVEGPAGKMMVVNASAEASDGLEIKLNGKKGNISAVRYMEHTEYLTVNNGSYDLVINEVGSDAIYHDPKFELRGGKSYTVFVFGTDSIKGVQVEDEIMEPNNDTDIRLRFFNFTEDTPMLDLSTATEISLVPIFQNRSIESLASVVEHSAFVTMDSGTYSLRLVDSASDGTLLEPVEFALDAGTSYTVIAYGKMGSPDHPLTLSLIKNTQ